MKMSNEKVYSSCIPQEPLIKFGDGTAPVIDYTMPQGTCIPIIGKIQMRLDLKVFTSEVQKVPAGNFWDVMAKKDIESIKVAVLRDLTSGISRSKYIANIWIAQKYQKTGGNLTVSNSSAQSRQGTIAESAPISLGAETTFDVANLADAISSGLMPVLEPSLCGKPKMYLVARPLKPTPRIYLLEQYKICSYLGNYGMGKTVSTFTLLPGEKTTISVKTYQDITTTKSKSENVIDSLTEASSEEFENTLKDESGTKDSNTSSSSSTDSASLSAGGSFLGISASGSVGTSSTDSTSSTREAFKTAWQVH